MEKNIRKYMEDSSLKSSCLNRHNRIRRTNSFRIRGYCYRRYYHRQDYDQYLQLEEDIVV